MMSRTHLAVGMTAALALTTANNAVEVAAIIAGGALGGVFADVDILDNDYKSDALIGELIALGTVVLAVLCDLITGKHIVGYIADNKAVSILGGVGLIVLWVVGYNTEHREFTHSLLAMLLVSLSAWLVFPIFGVAVLLGYLSHLLLDLLNKKGIRLLFPLKPKMCLKLCYASGTANKVFMIAGFALTAVLLVYKILVLKSVN